MAHEVDRDGVAQKRKLGFENGHPVEDREDETDGSETDADSE